jgi:hypothetical protein
VAVPVPPDVLDPRLAVWPTDQPFLRVHQVAFRSAQFHPGGSGVRGRFHFFPDATGIVVPILYGAEDEDTAIAEIVFRDIRSGGVVLRPRLAGLAISEVRPKRDLRLIELHGYGLKRLGLHPNELTSTGPAEYAGTVAWAKALHASVIGADGLVWMSHQFNTRRALMLFGDRVSERDLEGGSPLPLIIGAGLDVVEHCANQAGITIL